MAELQAYVTCHSKAHLIVGFFVVRKKTIYPTGVPTSGTCLRVNLLYAD
ncbi:MAG: hypothetical protein E7H59_14685 [Acinetobacter baumannii]|nr:hypothetical protein [Acinetobacter baumannii]